MAFLSDVRHFIIELCDIESYCFLGPYRLWGKSLLLRLDSSLLEPMKF